MVGQSRDCCTVDTERSKYRNEHIACISSSIMPCFYGKYTIQFNYIICCSLRQGFQQGQTILKRVPLFFFFKRANQKGFVILKSLRGNYEWFCAIQKWKIPPQSPKSSSLFCFKNNRSLLLHLPFTLVLCMDFSNAENENKFLQRKMNKE